MSRQNDLEAAALRLLDDAESLRIDLSEDATYDLNFISDNLKKVVTYQGRLGDIQMKLTKIVIATRQASQAAKDRVQASLKDLRASDDYKQVPLNEKGQWLANQLADENKEAAEWKQLEDVVSEIRKAVDRQVGLMRRMDSDLRLHSKIYEARVAAGATSPGSYTGSSTEDINIE